MGTKQPGSTSNEVVDGVGVAKITPVAVSGGSTPKYTGLALQLSQCSELKKLCTCVTSKKSSCVTKYKSCTLILQQCLRKVGLYFDGRVDGL